LISNFYLKSKKLILSGKEKIKKFLASFKKPTPEWQGELDKKLTLSLNKGRFPSLKQIKYLAQVFSKKEIKIIRNLSLVILVCLLFLGTVIYIKHIVKIPASGGEYIEGLIGSPRYINPLLAQTNDVDMDISRLLFSGLFRYNQNLELVPDLASSYEISQDGKTYTIYLRQDTKWHDGENLTVEDIIFTVESIQNPEFRSPLASSLRGVKIEKIDDYSFKFILLEPYAPFPENLAFGILPEHLWINIPAINANLAEYNIKPIGSGPFQFKSLTKDKLGNIKSYLLQRNENYYSQKTYLKKITFKFYPEFEGAVEALKNKEIEGIGFLPKEFRGTIKNKDLNFYSFELPKYTALFFNPKNNEILKDKNIRQALAFGIEREKIVKEVLKDEGKIIDGPILPEFLGFNPDIKKYNFDPQKVAELLDKAEWKLLDGQRKNKDKNLEVTLTTVDQTENYKAVELIKNNWESFGIKVNLQIIPANRIQREIIKPRAYEILLFSEILGSDPDPFPFWHSSQIGDPGLNLATLANRHIDQLLEEARKTSDREERRMKYIQFQNLLAEEMPAIFLYNQTYSYVNDKKIKGIELKRIIVPSDRFTEIEKWYIKTKRIWK
jgi:peptide/nickel transport system substrate-binding protein